MMDDPAQDLSKTMNVNFFGLDNHGNNETEPVPSKAKWRRNHTKCSTAPEQCSERAKSQAVKGDRS